MFLKNIKIWGCYLDNPRPRLETTKTKYSVLLSLTFGATTPGGKAVAKK